MKGGVIGAGMEEEGGIGAVVVVVEDMEGEEVVALEAEGGGDGDTGGRWKPNLTARRLAGIPHKINGIH